MTKICVFCSSTGGLHQDYVETAKEMGQLIGERGHHLVYGGSHKGLMGTVSKEAAKHSDKITEIIPKIFEDVAIGKHNIIITEDFGERLREMQSRSDAFIVLPGGFGSLHELMDILVAKQLRLHNKPLVIINTNELYSPIIRQIQKIISEDLAPKDNHTLTHVVETPMEALEYIENYVPVEIEDKRGP